MEHRCNHIIEYTFVEPSTFSATCSCGVQVGLAETRDEAVNLLDDHIVEMKMQEKSVPE